MTSPSIPISAAAVLVVWAAACKDDNGETSPTQDAGTDTAVQSDTQVDQDEIPGLFGFESDDPEEEWSDCISNCDHAIEPQFVDLTNFQLDGLRGRIDGGQHIFERSGVDVSGPDIDLFGLLAPPRLMIEITVEPAGTRSMIDPVVTTHDGFASMTFSDDRSEGDITARTVVASPYVGSDLPFYFFVEDAINYENFQPGGGSFVGGDEYEYIVRFDTFEFAPQDLGTLDETTRELTFSGGRLEDGGDINYHRFYAPATSRPTVEFTRTGSSAFLGTLYGTSTIGGQLTVQQPPSRDTEEENTGIVTLPFSQFRVCHDDCDDVVGEFIFSVSDWNGRADPGEFTYDLRVFLP